MARRVRARPTSSGAPVRDRHQPRLDVGVGGQFRVGPKRRQEGLRPCVLGVDGPDDGAAHPQHGRAVLGHHVFERSHPHIMKTPRRVACVRSVLGELLQRGDEIAFEAVPVDADPVQRTVVVLHLEEGERDVLGPDVVVTQPKCLSEGQFEYLLGGAVERDQRGHLPVDARRQGDDLLDGADVDALTGEQLDRESVGVVEQRQ